MELTIPKVWSPRFLDSLTRKVYDSDSIRKEPGIALFGDMFLWREDITISGMGRSRCSFEIIMFVILPIENHLVKGLLKDSAPPTFKSNH